MAKPASACKAVGGDSLRDTARAAARPQPGNPAAAALSAAERQPLLARWFARQWWQAGGADNAAALFAYALRPDAAAPASQPSRRFACAHKAANSAPS